MIGMPVYHDYRLIHVHIPKTAGTAIARCFEKAGAFEWRRDFWVGTEWKDGRLQRLSILE